MSLTIEEKNQTRLELKKNYEISGLALEAVQDDLDFTSTGLTHAFELTLGHDPTNVWKLRDYLEKKILEQGKEIYPFSVLKKNIYYPY